MAISVTGVSAPTAVPVKAWTSGVGEVGMLSWTVRLPGAVQSYQVVPFAPRPRPAGSSGSLVALIRVPLVVIGEPPVRTVAAANSSFAGPGPYSSRKLKGCVCRARRDPA